MRFWRKFSAAVFLALILIVPAAAEERFLIVPLSAVEQTAPDSPSLTQNTNWIGWNDAHRAIPDSPDVEAYFARGIPAKFRNFEIWEFTPSDGANSKPDFVGTFERKSISERFPAELDDVENGEIFLVVKTAGSKPAKITFDRRHGGLVTDPDSRIAEFQLDWDALYSPEKDTFAKTAFLLCECDHYDKLARDNPGAPVFATSARNARNRIFAEFDVEQTVDGQPRAPAPTNWDDRRGNSLVRSFDLLSGSRAIEQNLEIDAAINAWQQEKRTVDIDGITGITVAEIDWQPLTENLGETKIDKLAFYVPADQHIIVFPDFLTALKFAKLTEQSGLPVLQFLNYRDTSTDKRTFQRYQAQLGLSMDALTEQLGPSVIDAVAVTGGDMYFPTGTDITVLFETKNADALVSLLVTKMAIKFSGDKSVQNAKGKIGDFDCVSFVNFDRSASAFVAKIDANTVAVSNSDTSLQRIVGVKSGEIESLASLDEYRFFRDRYKVGDESESVFAFLSDATIRRWCGPKWRIAASRRLWQQAILGRLQVEHIDAIVSGAITESRPVAIESRNALPGENADADLVAETEYSLAPTGVTNKAFGSYKFLTPITEMAVEKISGAERDAYNRWRDEYEGRWRRNFDPIGLRITLADKTMVSDVTVMPINVRTNREFEEMFGFSTGAEFAPDQSVYGTPLQWIVSINIESRQFTQNANFAEQMAGGVSLGWVGSHFTVFADEDPFWNELLDAFRELGPGEWPYDFLFEEGNLSRLPVGVEVASNNPLRLATFLTGLRTMVEQSAPDLLRWETLKHSDVSYVKVSSKSEDNFIFPGDFAIYYTPADGKLFITLSESLLKRHIDRRLEIKADIAANTDATPSQTTPRPWLGQNLALRLDERAVPVLDRLYMSGIPEKMTAGAWRNVPIMNEYQLRFPDKDPVEVHELLWGERLFCPNDGGYVWNETLQTYEPMLGEIPQNSPLANVKEADLGVTFENEGIRARVQLELK